MALQQESRSVPIAVHWPLGDFAESKISSGHGQQPNIRSSQREQIDATAEKSTEISLISKLAQLYPCFALLQVALTGLSIWAARSLGDPFIDSVVSRSLDTRKQSRF